MPNHWGIFGASAFFTAAASFWNLRAAPVLPVADWAMVDHADGNGDFEFPGCMKNSLYITDGATKWIAQWATP